MGKTAGDYTLLDPQAGYTTATCYVDAMGHLDAVQLSGGTRAEEGILVKVENGTGGQRLQVSAFNGETRRYTLPAGAGVVGLVFLGRFLLQKYKSKKEWKEYNK